MKGSGIHTENLDFFDCNCIVGQMWTPPAGGTLTVEELLRKMRYAGIKQALVRDSMATSYHPTPGNRKTLEVTKGKANLVPAWVLLPHHTGLVQSPEKLVASMLKEGVRAAFLMPGGTKQMGYRFMLDEWVCGALFRNMERHRVPVFVHLKQHISGGAHTFEEWRSIYGLCRRHPGLRVILLGVRSGENRNLYPVLDVCRNLHIETSCYQSFRGLEDLCKKFGPRRLLFGTCIPFLPPGGSICMVANAGIPPAEKKLIAGDNLRRLLGEVRI